MTFLSKQVASNGKQFFDLTRQSDEDLHCLMDSVTNEMARRASVNAKRRALVRRLEVIAESEGVTLDEVRLYLRGDHRVPVSRREELELEIQPSPAEEFPTGAIRSSGSAKEREACLEKQFESLLQRELAQ